MRAARGPFARRCDWRLENVDEMKGREMREWIVNSKFFCFRFRTLEKAEEKSECEAMTSSSEPPAFSRPARRRGPPDAQSDMNSVLRDVLVAVDDDAAARRRRKLQEATAVRDRRALEANPGVTVMAVWKGKPWRAEIKAVHKITREAAFLELSAVKHEPTSSAAVNPTDVPDSDLYRFVVRFLQDDTVAHGLHFNALQPTDPDTTRLTPPENWSIPDFSKMIRELEQAESRHRATGLEEEADVWSLMWDARPVPPKVPYQVQRRDELFAAEATLRSAIDNVWQSSHYDIVTTRKPDRHTAIRTSLSYWQLAEETQRSDIQNDLSQQRLALVDRHRPRPRDVFTHLRGFWQQQEEAQRDTLTEEAYVSFSDTVKSFRRRLSVLLAAAPSPPPSSPPPKPTLQSSPPRQEIATQTPTRSRTPHRHYLHKPCPVEYRPPFRPSSGSVRLAPSSQLSAPMYTVRYPNYNGPADSATPSPKLRGAVSAAGVVRTEPRHRSPVRSVSSQVNPSTQLGGPGLTPPPPSPPQGRSPWEGRKV